MDFSAGSRLSPGTIKKAALYLAACCLAAILVWSISPWVRRYLTQLPGLIMSRVERERVESGDPGIWDAVSRLRALPAYERDVLVLWRGPEDWRMIFGFYRLNYELYPRRTWFVPLPSSVPGTGSFGLSAETPLVSGARVLGKNANLLERIPVGATGAGNCETAALVSYGRAGESAFYRVGPGGGGGLKLKRISPAPDPGRRAGPKRPWLWPTAMGTVTFIGLLFGFASGLSRASGPGRGVQLSVAFLSGWGLIGFSMTAASLAGAPWSTPLLLALTATLLASLWYIGSRRLWPGLPLPHPGQNEPLWRGDRIGLALVAIAIALSVVQAMIPFDPHHNWDTWAIWDLKTRACWHERGLPFEYLRERSLHFTHREYPLGIPLLQTYLAFWAGGIDHVLLRFLSPVFHFTLLALTAGLLRELGIGRGRWLAAGLLGMVPMFLRQAANGAADLPMAAAMVACLLLAVRAVRGAAPLWSVAWMGGVAATIKEEGMVWGAACLLVAWLGMKRGPAALRRLAAGALLLAALLIPWKGITAYTELGSTTRAYEFPRIIAQVAARIWPIVRAAAMETIGPGVGVGAGVTDVHELVYRPLRNPGAFIKHPLGQWLLLWHFVFLALALNWRRLAKPPQIYIAGVLAIQSVAVAFAYVSTVYDIEWHLAYSFDRVMLQLAPSAFALALACAFRKEDPPA